MPELPDVEGFRRVLAEHTGEPIETVRVHDTGALRDVSAHRLEESLRGHRFTAPRRHGKWLIAPVGGPVLLFHFGMTGSLSWHPPGDPRHRHDRIEWVFNDGELRYRDMRKLQGVRLLDSESEADEVIGDTGPDALDISRTAFTGLLAKRRRNLKSTLTDQSAISGLGNLLADEICWRARINPFRTTSDLDEREQAALHRAMRQVLRTSLKAERVPPRRNWLTGARDRPDPTCPRCGTPFTQDRISGRTTFWCPTCQPQ